MRDGSKARDSPASGERPAGDSRQRSRHGHVTGISRPLLPTERLVAAIRWISGFGIQNTLDQAMDSRFRGNDGQPESNVCLAEMTSFPRKRESISVGESRNLRMDVPGIGGNADCRYGPSGPRPARPGVYSGPRGAVPSLRRVPYRSRDGGTGRRAGLKIQYWRQCASSSLAPGTNPSLPCPSRAASTRAPRPHPRPSGRLASERVAGGRPPLPSARCPHRSPDRRPRTVGRRPHCLHLPGGRSGETSRSGCGMRFRTPVCRNLRAVPAFSERATGSGSAGRRGRSSAACRTGGRSRRRRGRSRSPRR